jgi:protein-S-isoprenylcysteine O-methyltransferase Ste14
MSLRIEFEKSGSWLFRYRSFILLAALPIIVAGLCSYTYLGPSHRLKEFWDVSSFLVSFAGLAVRVFTIGSVPEGTSGRNTRQQVADTLNTSGMYSLVRHPLYLGNYLIWLGMAMFFHTWWMVLLVTCLYALYFERVMFAEEAFLRQRFGDAFERWTKVTPAIIPRLHGWQSPGLPFSWRTVLRREYTGFFCVIAAFFLLKVTGESIVEGRLRIDWPWAVLFLFGTAVYLTLRTLKKRTRILDVPGR